MSILSIQLLIADKFKVRTTVDYRSVYHMETIHNNLSRC